MTLEASSGADWMAKSPVIRGAVVGAVLLSAAAFVFVLVVEARSPSYDHSSTIAIALVFAAGGTGAGLAVGGLIGGVVAAVRRRDDTTHREAS
jgi:hypothetical protein